MRTAGFTLVETLIAASIGALLLVGTHAVLSSVFEITNTIESRIGTEEEMRLTTLLLRSDIAHARRAERGATTLTLFRTSGDTVVYTHAASSNPLVRTRSGADPETLIASADLAAFSLLTANRQTVREAMTHSGLVIVEAFEPGDWDSLVAATSCSYAPRVAIDIDGTHWVGQEFELTEDAPAVTWLSIRAAAPSLTPIVDLLVELRSNDDSGAGRPATLLASGRVPVASLTAAQTWFDVLVAGTGVALQRNTTYWIVVRGGGNLTQYAGTVEVETLAGCLSSDLPKDERRYRGTSDAGATWSARNDTQDSFFRVYRGTGLTKLEELQASEVETVGVSYRLNALATAPTETRTGYVALHPS